MEVFLNLNGFQLLAAIDEQERLMLDLAAGSSSWQALIIRLAESRHWTHGPLSARMSAIRRIHQGHGGYDSSVDVGETDRLVAVAQLP